MANMAGWAPPGVASDPKHWRYDMKQGWLEPGQMGSIQGTQLHMPPGFDPKARGQGWQMVVSPPGVPAPVGALNYTPATQEVHAPGIPAPVDQMNLSAVPASQSPTSPPPSTGMSNDGTPYMQGTYTDDLARQLAEALGGWSASSPGQGQDVGYGADPEDPDGFGGAPNSHITPAQVRATSPAPDWGYRGTLPNQVANALGGVQLPGMPEDISGQLNVPTMGANAGVPQPPIPASPPMVQSPSLGGQPYPDYHPPQQQPAPAPAPASNVQLTSTGSGVPSAGSPSPTTLPSIDRSGDPNKFFASIMPYARQYEAQTGVPAQIAAAMAASESNYGRAPGNMLFGVKYTGAPGTTSTGPLATWESVNGQRVNTNAEFESFDSPQAAFQGLGRTLSNPIYADAMANRSDPTKFVQLLNQAGYATDPNWANNVIIPLSQRALAAEGGGGQNGINAQGGVGSHQGPMYSSGSYDPDPTTRLIPYKDDQGNVTRWGIPDPDHPGQVATNSAGDPVTFAINPKDAHIYEANGQVYIQDLTHLDQAPQSLGTSNAARSLAQDQRQFEVTSRINQQNANNGTMNAETSRQQVNQPSMGFYTDGSGQGWLYNTKGGDPIKWGEPGNKTSVSPDGTQVALFDNKGTLKGVQDLFQRQGERPQEMRGGAVWQLDRQSGDWKQTSPNLNTYQVLGTNLYQMGGNGERPVDLGPVPRGSQISTDSQTGAIRLINPDTGQMQLLDPGRRQRETINGRSISFDEQGNPRVDYSDPTANQRVVGDQIVEYDPASHAYHAVFQGPRQPIDLGKGHWLIPEEMHINTLPGMKLAGHTSAQNAYMGSGQYGETPQSGWDVSGPSQGPAYNAFTAPGQGQDVGTGADVSPFRLPDPSRDEQSRGIRPVEGGLQENVQRSHGSSLSLSSSNAPGSGIQGPWGYNDAPLQLTVDDNGDASYDTGARSMGVNAPMSPVYRTGTDQVHTTPPDPGANPGGYVPGQVQTTIPPQHPEGWSPFQPGYFNDIPQPRSVGGGADVLPPVNGPVPSAPMGGPAQPPSGGWTPPVPPQSVVGTGNRFGQQVDMEGIHKGLDFQAVQGTPAIAPADGTVVAVQNKPDGLGQQVLIRDAGGQVHTLSHMESIDVHEGDQVRAGQPVGTVGSTGAGSTGPHMDYRVQGPAGEYRDPSQLAGPLAQMPTVNKAPVGQGGSGWDPNAVGVGYDQSQGFQALGNLDGFGGGPTDYYGSQESQFDNGGGGSVSAPWGGLGNSMQSMAAMFPGGGTTTPATSSGNPFMSPLDASLYGPNQGGGNSAPSPASASPAGQGYPGPTALDSGYTPPRGWNGFSSGEPGATSSGSPNIMPQIAAQQAANAQQGAQAQQQTAAVNYQQQQLALQQQNLAQQYQQAKAQLDQQWAIHKDDMAYQQQLLQLQDQWKKADQALTTQQDELNRQMQLLVQGSEAQREKFATTQSALKNPWLQQLTGMAPGWHEAGGPGTPQNPTNGIINPQGWNPNVGITGQGQDVGMGADAPIINGVSGGGLQSGQTGNPSNTGASGWGTPPASMYAPASGSMYGSSPASNSPSPSAAQSPGSTPLMGSTSPSSSSGPNSSTSFNPTGIIFGGTPSGPATPVSMPWDPGYQAPQVPQQFQDSNNAYQAWTLLPGNEQYANVPATAASVTAWHASTAAGGPANGGGGGGQGSNGVTVPPLPALPDWNSYLSMTPFQRAALRTNVEATGTAWEDFVNQMRTKWGNEGGPTQAPGMTALAAAHQTPRDYLGNSQIAESFGNTADEYWNQQARGWSPSAATSVSLVA